MSELEAATAAARAYDDLFVPALFAQYASALVAIAELQSGEFVLDVACGTGALAREAQARVAPEGRASGLDLNPGMLAVAAEKNPQVSWHEGTAEALPFADGSFDAVVSQFGLMFFPDRSRAIGEMLRVLRPGGRLVIAVWDAIEKQPGYAAELALIERLAGTEAADPVRVPFVLGAGDTFRDLVTADGSDVVEIASRRGDARFPSIRVMVEAELRGWLPIMGVYLTDAQIEEILTAAETDLERFREPNGEVTFPVYAHVASIRKR